MKFRISIALKLSSFVTALCVLLIVIMTRSFFDSSYDDLESKYGKILQHIAINAVFDISGEEHAKIQSEGDEKLAEFQNIKKHLQKIQRVNYLESDAIYTFHVDQNLNLKFGVMLSEKPFIGHSYKPPPQNIPIFREVYGGLSRHTKIYGDEHGHWISGMAPILSSKGKFSGILEVDYKMDTFLAELAKRRERILITSGAVLLLGILLSFIIALSISRPLGKIKDASLNIINGDYNHELRINTRDEIGELAKSFNHMVRSLKERFHMMKYISQGTIDMIKRIESHEELQKGERKKMAILFSDIRGFTSYSEKRYPEEVVSMLNLFLGTQTKIIHEHDGQIDKFVGDEVVVLFDGDKKDINAVNCAVAIQSAIKKINDSSDIVQELNVGIGITCGDVVMGNIGSEDRMDYTAIGRFMNLAARLCGAAKGMDTIITKNVYDELLKDKESIAKVNVNPLGTAEYKGIQGNVEIYSVKGKV